MFYLDTNIFVFASVFSGDKSERAKKLLRDLADDKISAATNILTIEETIWVLLKITKDREFSIEQGSRLLSIKRLKLLSSTQTTMINAVVILKKYKKIKSRDALHAASCIENNIKSIVSDDADFEEIKEVKRVRL